MFTKHLDHTECFAKHAKWMAPYRMYFPEYVLNGWPHTEWFTKHTK